MVNNYASMQARARFLTIIFLFVIFVIAFLSFSLSSANAGSAVAAGASAEVISLKNIISNALLDAYSNGKLNQQQLVQELENNLKAEGFKKSMRQKIIDGVKSVLQLNQTYFNSGSATNQSSQQALEQFLNSLNITTEGKQTNTTEASFFEMLSQLEKNPPSLDNPAATTLLDKLLESFNNYLMSIPQSEEEVLAKEASVQFLIDWKAESVVPRGYQGKALPGPSTKINVSFNIIDNNKLVDLSNRQIRWYLDDELIESGIGLQTFSFRTFRMGDTYHRVRVEVSNYKNHPERLGAVTTIRVPVIFPKVVLEAPFPHHVFSSQKARLPAKIFYYSKDALASIILSWEIDGNRASVTNPKNQTFLDIDMTDVKQKKEINILVEAENVTDQLGITSANISLSLTYLP
ncbi:hypothetical protein D6779_06030 [Candidatus Parcubacteria bacterium]|nr:MAG: hypothetical protein D6779_06030 [Candidatus Parcubacteria bacterium]